jgi:hypothetical protein
VIYHASPSVEGQPWYDVALILWDSAGVEDDATRPRKKRKVVFCLEVRFYLPMPFTYCPAARPSAAEALAAAEQEVADCAAAACAERNASFTEKAAHQTISNFRFLTDPSVRLVARVCPSRAPRPPPGPAEFRAGELKVFVSLLVPTDAYLPNAENKEELDVMQAMLHYFCARGDREEQQRGGRRYDRDVFDVYHPRSLAKTVPFPLMQFAFTGSAKNGRHTMI